MPELPEMETYRSLLLPRLMGKKISQALVTREKSINMAPDAFSRLVAGRSITGVSRRAKHLLFHVEGGFVLVLHFMLGGTMFWGRPEEKPDRTVQVELVFGEERLYFIGLRLGYLHLHTVEDAEAILRKLGPEPLEPSFGEGDFIAAVKRKRGVLKPALTDQSVLAGIGNCYADEICFAAGVLPARKIGSLEELEWKKLFRSMREVLVEAIRYGGYMDQPLFRGDTLTGGFDSRCRVYDRGGEPCVRCGNKVVQEELSSRKVFYCTHCQR